MRCIDGEIGAVGPKILALCARRGIRDGEAGWEDFVEGEAERDVLVRRGVCVAAAIFPVKSRERQALISNL